MYGYPHDVDLSFLKNRELQQICIGRFQLQFHFDGDVAIFTESDFTYISKGDTHNLKSSPESSSFIVRLLGNSIVNFEVTSDEVLCLRFSNGDEIFLSDDKTGYECYQIRHGEKLIVV